MSIQNKSNESLCCLYDLMIMIMINKRFAIICTNIKNRSTFLSFSIWGGHILNCISKKSNHISKNCGYKINSVHSEQHEIEDVKPSNYCSFFIYSNDNETISFRLTFHFPLKFITLLMKRHTHNFCAKLTYILNIFKIFKTFKTYSFYLILYRFVSFRLI